MAAKSVVDIAIEHLDAQIADLNRAKHILDLARQSTIGTAHVTPTGRKRGRPKKYKQPATEQSNGD